MLGHKLVQVLQTEFDVWTTLREKFIEYKKFKIFNKSRVFEKINVQNLESINKIINSKSPDVVINAVGIIKQLPNSKDVIQTLSINSLFPHYLAEICFRKQIYLINISTDCVFDGVKGNYTEDDISNASDLYGRSKSLGEVTGERCVTFRTSIIGRELFTRHSLVEWFLQSEDSKIKGFVNAIYTGFPTIILAEIISSLLKREIFLEGLYHISSEPINKFVLLNLLKKTYRKEIEIEPFEDFKIDRSLNSDKFRQETDFEPQSWEEMVETMGNDKFPYQNK